MTPINHCQQLLALLDTLAPTQYDQSQFRASVMADRCCALAHAARAGIGGLRIGSAWAPWHVDAPHDTPDVIADRVFGEGAWERVFGPDALNARLGVVDFGDDLTFDWHLHGEPVSEDAVYARLRGADALEAARMALAEHMVTVS